MDKYIILASQSKRRSEILSSCGIKHKIFVTGVEEHMCHKMAIAKLVMLNARRKTEAAEKFFKKGIILGVDTLVLLKNRPIGKPENETAAKKLLKALSGNIVFVYTGLCLLDKEKNISAEDFDKTKLKVKNIPPKDINRYFELLKPYDKAGGFSIEGPGSLLFDDLIGSYFNVLGLPMGKLAELFKRTGYNILDFIK